MRVCLNYLNKGMRALITLVGARVPFLLRHTTEYECNTSICTISSTRYDYV